MYVTIQPCGASCKTRIKVLQAIITAHRFKLCFRTSAFTVAFICEYSIRDNSVSKYGGRKNVGNETLLLLEKNKRAKHPSVFLRKSCKLK